MKTKIIYTFATAFLLIAFSQSIVAQSLHLYGIKTNEYPTIKAKFIAMDSYGDQISNLSETDVTINENGLTREVQYISCPESEGPVPISSVLTLDISGSMTGSGLAMAKAAAIEWINALPDDGSDCAISSFDQSSYINQDFTEDKSKLISAVNALTANGGTNFTAGLLKENTGALDIVTNGKNKPVVVFLTDGAGMIDVDKAVEEANFIGATVFCISVSYSLSNDLKEIATRTGGLYFEKILDQETLKQVFLEIQARSRISEACDIEWLSDGCDQEREVVMGIPAYSLSYVSSYKMDFYQFPHLAYSPYKVARFDYVDDQTKLYDTLTVTAEIGDVYIEEFVSENTKFSVVDYGGSEPPFTLKKGESRTIIIEYTPVDEEYTCAKININTDACVENKIYCVLSNPNSLPKLPTLKVTHPNGGEVFMAASDTVITWEGIPLDDKVKLEYSIDAGQTWTTITDTASNWRYVWHAPDVESDKCLIRASQLGEVSSYRKPAVLYSELVAGECVINDITWSPDEQYVATVDNRGHLTIWDYNTEMPIINCSVGPRLNPVYDVAWNHKGDLIAVSYDSTIEIFNASNLSMYGKIDTPIGNSSLHDNTIDWSPDDKYILTTNDNSVHIFEIDGQGALMKSFAGREVDIAYYSPLGDRIFVSSKDVGTNGSLYLEILNSDLSVNSNYPISKGTEFIDILDMDWGPSGEEFALAMELFRGFNYIMVYDNYFKTFVSGVPFSNLTNVAWHPSRPIIAVNNEVDIQLYDYIDSTIIKTLQGHIKLDTGVITEIEWSKSGNMLATCGGDHTARIWFIGGAPLQTDVSDSLFTIVKPSINVSVNSVDMGEVVVDSYKDSVVTGFIENTNQVELILKSVSINTPNIFDCTTILPDTIQPGEKINLEFRFSPSATGNFSSEMEFDFGSENKYNSIISGTGVENVLSTDTEDEIDLGCFELEQEYTATGIIKVVNEGAREVVITKVEIIGPDQTQFSLGGNYENLILSSGSMLTFDVIFKSLTVGRTSTVVSVEYEGMAEPMQFNIFAQVGDCDGELLFVKSLDFGDVVVQQSAEKFEVFVENSTERNISVLSSTLTGADASCFSIIQGGAPFTVYADSTHKMRVEFIPNSIGPKNAEIIFEYESEDSPITSYLTGNGIFPDEQLLLRAGSIKAASGEVFNLPVYIENPNKLEFEGLEGIYANLVFNSTLMVPNGDTPIGYLDNGRRKIGINIPASAIISGMVEYRFMATLGNSKSTLITFDSIGTTGLSYNVGYADGDFALTDVCSEGGDRLLINTANKSMSESLPNPASKESTISYTLIEEGQVSLNIYDANGIMVMEVENEFKSPGTYELTLDVSGLSSGIYYYILITDSERTSRKFTVIK